MAPVVVPKRVLASTLRSVRWAGRLGNERVVLWLGRRVQGAIQVLEHYVPKQMAARDMFRIPPVSMRSLMKTLGRKNLMVAAQVHTHPHEAFHSAADDRWAVVRHVGALSLVLPDFAQRTTAASFLRDAATFCLSADGVWDIVQPDVIADYVEVQP